MQQRGKALCIKQAGERSSVALGCLRELWAQIAMEKRPGREEGDSVTGGWAGWWWFKTAERRLQCTPNLRPWYQFTTHPWAYSGAPEQNLSGINTLLWETWWAKKSAHQQTAKCKRKLTFAPDKRWADTSNMSLILSCRREGMTSVGNTVNEPSPQVPMEEQGGCSLGEGTAPVHLKTIPR
jgi:hypothetical protein